MIHLLLLQIYEAATLIIWKSNLLRYLFSNVPLVYTFYELFNLEDIVETIQKQDVLLDLKISLFETYFVSIQ